MICYRATGLISVDGYFRQRVCLTWCWFSGMTGPVLTVIKRNSPNGFYVTALSDKGMEKMRRTARSHSSHWSNQTAALLYSTAGELSSYSTLFQFQVESYVGGGPLLALPPAVMSQYTDKCFQTRRLIFEPVMSVYIRLHCVARWIQGACANTEVVCTGSFDFKFSHTAWWEIKTCPSWLCSGIKKQQNMMC